MAHWNIEYKFGGAVWHIGILNISLVVLYDTLEY